MRPRPAGRPAPPDSRTALRLAAAAVAPRWRLRRTVAAAALAGRDRMRPLLLRRGGHWAMDYAARLAERSGPARPVLIQTSMSPSGPFHVGNLRDSITAHLVARALRLSGHRARLMLSFDDYDALHPGKTGRPELAGFVGRPMADADDHARQVCRRYVAELKRLGICPADADADGLTDADADADWVVRYQARTYRAGHYLGWQRLLVQRRAVLATALGAAPERLFRPYCRTCGRNTTVTHALSARGVSYSCLSCTAAHREGDLRTTKPAWAVDWMMRVLVEGIDCEPAGHDHCSSGSTMDRTRTVFPDLFGRPQPVIVPYGLVRQDGHGGKISGSRGGGLRAEDLLAVMDPRMLLWLYARHDCRRDIRVGLDLATLCGWYAGYDAFCRRVRAGAPADAALWRLISDDPPPAEPPPFRQVVGLAQSYFFEAATVLDRPAPHAGLTQRFGYARAWLAGPGRDAAWFPRRPQPRPEPWPGLPGADAVAGGDRLSPDGYHAVAWALFGVPTAPPLSRAVECFGKEGVVDALEEFTRSGRRPLRAVLAARLGDDDREDAG